MFPFVAVVCAILDFVGYIGRQLMTVAMLPKKKNRPVAGCWSFVAFKTLRT